MSHRCELCFSSFFVSFQVVIPRELNSCERTQSEQSLLLAAREVVKMTIVCTPTSPSYLTNNPPPRFPLQPASSAATRRRRRCCLPAILLLLVDCCVGVTTIVFVVTATATATAIAAVTVVVALVVVVVNSSGIRTQGRSSIGRGCFPSTVLRFILAAGR